MSEDRDSCKKQSADDSDILTSESEKSMSNAEVCLLSDEEECFMDQIPKTRNEIINQHPDMNDIPESIDASASVHLLGHIFGIVEDQIVVQSQGMNAVLDLDNLLVAADRKVVGRISDIFGPVDAPFYAFYSSKQLLMGQPIYFSPEASSTVQTQMLLKQKGSDASNLFDEEIGEEEAEFSEDEKEENFKKAVKKKIQKKDATLAKPDKNVAEYDVFDYQPLSRPAEPERLPAVDADLPPLSVSPSGGGRRAKKETLVNESALFIPQNE